MAAEDDFVAGAQDGKDDEKLFVFLKVGGGLFGQQAEHAAATLYSSVGHAGASGYLAAMALVGVAPQVMKPTALVLNVLGALIATYRFYRVGAFSWGILWPFSLGSVPLAFVGGALTLPGYLYKPVVAAVLLAAAYRLWRQAHAELVASRPVPVVPALIWGGGIGLLSGLTGVGGGIFLTPLLLFMHWAEPRQAAGVSAAFILVNSLAGLGGTASSLQRIPAEIGYLAIGDSRGAGWATRHAVRDPAAGKHRAAPSTCHRSRGGRTKDDVHLTWQRPTGL